jgi:hypothetical protein
MSTQACACGQRAAVQRSCADAGIGACAQVLLLSLLFTGYLVNIAAVTPVLQWVHYLSVFFFGFEGLIVNEMSGLNLVFQVPPRLVFKPCTTQEKRMIGKICEIVH